MNQLQRNVSGVLEWYALAEEGGIPTSATVVVTSSTGEVLRSSVSATCDTVSTTIASASAGDETVTVASGTGITVGRSYRLATAGGRYREVRVIEVSGTTVRFDEPVPWDITTGTLVGLRISYTWTSPPDKTHRECRVAWEYTAGGSTRRHFATLDIVRQPWSLALREADIEDVDPSWGATSSEYDLRRRAEDMLYARLSAMHREVRGEALGGPDLIRDRRGLVPAAVALILSLRHMRQPELAERWAMRYEESLSMYSASSAWYDADDDQIRASDLTLGPDGVATYPGQVPGGDAEGAGRIRSMMVG